MKRASWVYPKIDKGEGSSPTKNALGSLEKESQYIISGVKNLTGSLQFIPCKTSEDLENQLNARLFKNYSNIDEEVKVIPLQSLEHEMGQKQDLGPSDSFLRMVNPQLVCYNIVYYKQDFTLVNGQFCLTDVFFWFKSYYPFFSFFARLLNLLLSRSI